MVDSIRVSRESYLFSILVIDLTCIAPSSLIVAAPDNVSRRFVSLLNVKVITHAWQRRSTVSSLGIASLPAFCSHESVPVIKCYGFFSSHLVGP